MSWQPIKTVPKDRTRVILTDGYRLAVAWWDSDQWPDANQSDSCWCISDWHNDPIHLRGGYAATHWMPAPKAISDFTRVCEQTGLARELREERNGAVGNDRKI